MTWWGERAKLVQTGEAVSALLSGSLAMGLPSMLPSAEVTAVVLEFGTTGRFRVFRAMQAENWLHHHGGHQSPRTTKIKARMWQVFYPDTDAWKKLVWLQGKEVVDRAVGALADA